MINFQSYVLHFSRLFQSQSSIFSLKNNSDKFIKAALEFSITWKPNSPTLYLATPLTQFPNRSLHSIRSITPEHHRISRTTFHLRLARRLLSTSRLGTTDVYELLIRYTRNSHAARSLADSLTLRSLLEIFLFNSFHSTENSASERN